MTTHYEERMQVDLDTIHRKLRKVSDLVENQVQNAVEALLTGTDDLPSRSFWGTGKSTAASSKSTTFAMPSSSGMHPALVTFGKHPQH